MIIKYQFIMSETKKIIYQNLSLVLYIVLVYILSFCLEHVIDVFTISKATHNIFFIFFTTMEYYTKCIFLFAKVHFKT